VRVRRHGERTKAAVAEQRRIFRIGNERRSMIGGDVAVIPGDIEYEGFFSEDTEVVDVFAPPREDFLAGGTPSYMRAP
jgi:hypothetical protein